MANALRSRLNPAVRDVFRRCQMVTRYTSIESQYRFFATRGEVADEETNPPTKYTTSKAHSLSAQSARLASTRNEAPLSQSISLMLSLGAFLIYFGILRKENDLDAMIDRDISDRVPGLQEAHEKLRTKAGRDAGKKSVGLV